MSFTSHIDNKKKTNTRIRTYFNCRKMYSINFTDRYEKFCLSLHYNGTNSYLLMVQKFISLKQKILKLQQVYYV